MVGDIDPKAGKGNEFLARGEITARLARGATRHLLALGAGVVAEFILASGRRVDLMALFPDGTLWAVEIKSGIEDFRADGKWPEYREWCDCLYFCVAEDFPPERLPEEVGVLVADAFDAHCLRPAPAHRLHPSRRKAVTLKFALAAGRRLGQAGTS